MVAKENCTVSLQMQLGEKKKNLGRFWPFRFSWNFQCLIWHLSFWFSVICHLWIAALNKWESLNSCTIWGTFHSPVIKRSRGSGRIRLRKVDRHFNLSNINVRKLSYYESHWQYVSSATEAKAANGEERTAATQKCHQWLEVRKVRWVRAQRDTKGTPGKFPSSKKGLILLKGISYKEIAFLIVGHQPAVFLCCNENVTETRGIQQRE